MLTLLQFEPVGDVKLHEVWVTVKTRGSENEKVGG